jgi:hypothetical protein
LLFTVKKKLLTIEEPLDAGLKSTVGERVVGAGATAG